MLTFSRGPWLGALAAILVVAVVSAARSRSLRFGLVLGLMVLLLGSAMITSDQGGAVSRAISLQESPQVRRVVGVAPLGHIVTSFLRSGDQVERSGMPPPSGNRSDTFWDIDGTRTWVLAEPAPAHGRATLGYRMYVPDNSVLTWGIALDPRVWSPDKGDGVVFRVAIRDHQQTVAMYAMYLDPKNVAADRHIVRFALPLFGYAGETVVVRLMTSSGPRGDANFDSAGWLNPRLARVRVATSFEAYPYRQLPLTMVVRPLVHWQITSPQSRIGRPTRATRIGFPPGDGRWPGPRRPLPVWVRKRGRSGHSIGCARSAGYRKPAGKGSRGNRVSRTGAVDCLIWPSRGGCMDGLSSRPRVDLDPRRLGMHRRIGCRFQVLEVKQMAALFWLLVGSAAALELSPVGVGPGRDANRGNAGLTGPFCRWWRAYRQGPARSANVLVTPVACGNPSTGADSSPVAWSSTGQSNTEEGMILHANNRETPGGGKQIPRYNGSEPDFQIMPVETGAGEHATRRVVQGSQDLPTIREVKLTPSESAANEHLLRGWELLLIGGAGNGAKFVLGLREVPTTARMQSLMTRTSGMTRSLCAVRFRQRSSEIVRSRL